MMTDYEVKAHVVKSDDVLKIINTLKSVQYQAGHYGALDMQEPGVCGTIKCVAGWYMEGKALEMGDLSEMMKRGKLWYWDGVRMIAEELGFKGSNQGYDFQFWLAHHQELWGNEHAAKLFDEEEAYDHDEEKGLTFSDVIAQWVGFYRRLRNAGF